MSPLTPFGVGNFVQFYELCFDDEHFHLILPSGDHNWVCDNHHSVDRLSAVGDWVKRCIHRGGRGALFRCEEAAYVKILFMRSTEKEVYA